jgi:hypothetical protein
MTDGNAEVLPRKNPPSVSMSTANPTWTVMGSNPVLCGEKPTIDHLIVFSKYTSEKMYTP